MVQTTKLKIKDLTAASHKNEPLEVNEILCTSNQSTTDYGPSSPPAYESVCGPGAGFFRVANKNPTSKHVSLDRTVSRPASIFQQLFNYLPETPNSLPTITEQEYHFSSEERVSALIGKT